MGCLASQAGSPAEATDPVEAAKNQEIGRAQYEAQQRDANIVKLLLLGTGDSGKTTLRKQFRNLYGAGFTLEGRLEFQSVILGVLVDGTVTVCDAIKGPLGLTLSSPGAVEAAARIAVGKSKIRHELAEDEVKDLKILVSDPAFKTALARSAEFQLQDCWSLYAGQLSDYPAWGGTGWVPSVPDCIAARVRTSGIQTEDIVLDSVTFKIFDVGGQRAERRKWISCFDGVTGVIFVAACSEYDQVLFEDKSKNRLEESVELFGEMCNHASFKQTPFILFLNKRDLFEKKFLSQHIELNVTGRFPSAPKGSTDDKAALAWMEQLFLSKNTTSRQVFVHVTTAVDPNNVKTVFNACKTILLSNSMAAGGFQ